MCFVYVDRPLTPPSPLVDKHGHFDNPPPPPLSTWFVHSPKAKSNDKAKKKIDCWGTISG